MTQPGNAGFGGGAGPARPEVGLPGRIARGLIKRSFKISPRLASALLDRVPQFDHEGIQVFTPNPSELRSVQAQGEPSTHSLVRFANLDYSLASGEWDSGPGRHEIKFDFDEWVHIVEGEAHVTVQGRTHVLRAGDAAMFRAGLSMTWDEPKYVRKIWVHRYPQKGLLERAALKIANLLGALPVALVLGAHAFLC
jgi:hypothetical protein